MDLANLRIYSMCGVLGASGFVFYRQSVPTERTGSLEQRAEDLWISVRSGFLQNVLFTAVTASHHP